MTYYCSMLINSVILSVTHMGTENKKWQPLKIFFMYLFNWNYNIFAGTHVLLIKIIERHIPSLQKV